MKKTMKKAIALILVVLTLLSATACTVKQQGNEGAIVVKVASYTGGVGEKWLDNLETRFEAEYASTTFSNGKVGIDIVTDSSKQHDGKTIEEVIETTKFDVIFTSSLNYFNLASKKQVLDLTDFIKNHQTKDGDTIYEKMSNEQQEVLNYNGAYYGIPHAEWFTNISYDAGVFKEKNLYFGEKILPSGIRDFVESQDSVKSPGPNGTVGDYDDGLPSSYQELYALIEAMPLRGCKPVVWNGSSNFYLNQLPAAAFVAYSGMAGIELNYKFKTDKPIEIVTGFNGDEPIIETKTGIAREDANLIRSSAGLYYATELGVKLFDDDNAYFHKDSAALATTHLDAMQTFMRSGLDGGDYVGMIIDGSYWYNEMVTDGALSAIETDYPSSYKQKEPKLMVLPKQYAGTVVEGQGAAPTALNTADSYVVVNKNASGDVLDAIYKFLAFAYSEDELCKFTEATNGILKAVNYDFSKCEGLSTYAQSVLDMRADAIKGGNYAYAGSQDSIYLKRPEDFTFNQGSPMWQPNVKGQRYTSFRAATNEGHSVKDIFLGLAISKDAWQSFL